MPAVLEGMHITYRGYERGGAQRTYAFNSAYTLTLLVTLKHTLNAVIIGFNPLVQCQ